MERPDLSNQTFRFAMSLRTRWVDEDNQEVLNNAIYLTLMEEARHGYFSDLSLLRENRFPFVLAQANVRFVSPGRGGCTVRVEAATTRMGRTSFEQVYRVLGPDGELWCEAEALLVGWDLEAKAKTELTPEFKAAVEGFEATFS